MLPPLYVRPSLNNYSHFHLLPYILNQTPKEVSVSNYTPAELKIFLFWAGIIP